MDKNKPATPATRKRFKREFFQFAVDLALTAAVGSEDSKPITIDSGDFFPESIQFRAVGLEASHVNLFSLKLETDAAKNMSTWIPCEAFSGQMYYNNSGVYSSMAVMGNGIPSKRSHPQVIRRGAMLTVYARNDTDKAVAVTVIINGYYKKAA
jgi:hypothetical protein